MDQKVKEFLLADEAPSEKSIEAMMSTPLGVRSVLLSLLTLRHTVNMTTVQLTAPHNETIAQLRATIAEQTALIAELRTPVLTRLWHRAKSLLSK